MHFPSLPNVVILDDKVGWQQIVLGADGGHEEANGYPLHFTLASNKRLGPPLHFAGSSGKAFPKGCVQAQVIPSGRDGLSPNGPDNRGRGPVLDWGGPTTRHPAKRGWGQYGYKCCGCMGSRRGTCDLRCGSRTGPRPELSGQPWPGARPRAGRANECGRGHSPCGRGHSHNHRRAGRCGGPCSEPNLNIVKLLKTYLNCF